MDEATQSQYQARATVIKAMGHPTRLFIVHELEHGEQCVCDLQAKIGVDLSTVSRHLAILRQAGIIASRKAGNQVFYNLQCPCVLNFFECVEKVLETNRMKSLTDLRIKE